MAIIKKKISELPLVQSLVGLFTIGVDSGNESCKVSLEFVQTSADSAAEAASSATSAAESANTAAGSATAAANAAGTAANDATNASNTANVAAQNADDAREAIQDDLGTMQTQVNQNTANIASLQGAGRVSAQLGDSPTQQQLTDAWTAVKSIDPVEGATVVNLDQDAPAGHAWTYFETGTGAFAWIDRGTDTVGQASNEVLGVVKGTTSSLGVGVNLDGTMQVNGLQTELNNRLSGATIGGSSVSVQGGIMQLPAYPTTLPASDVPAWAKAATKPAYTAAEVGALPLSGGTMSGGIECPNGNAGLRHALLTAAITPNIYSAITQCTWAVSGAKGGYSGFAVYNSNHAESWNFMGKDEVSGGIYKPSISKWLVRGNVSGGGSTSLEFGSVTVPNGGVSARDGFFQTSDARKKEVEKPLDCSLDEIAKLLPVYYRWKDAEQMGDARHIGLIAQEVQQLFPELVTEDEEGMLSLNYAELSAVAMRGIRLLKDKTDDLEDRLTQIEAKLSR